MLVWLSQILNILNCPFRPAEIFLALQKTVTGASTVWKLVRYILFLKMFIVLLLVLISSLHVPLGDWYHLDLPPHWECFGHVVAQPLAHSFSPWSNKILHNQSMRKAWCSHNQPQWSLLTCREWLRGGHKEGTLLSWIDGGNRSTAFLQVYHHQSKGLGSIICQRTKSTPWHAKQWIAFFWSSLWTWKISGFAWIPVTCAWQEWR